MKPICSAQRKAEVTHTSRWRETETEKEGKMKRDDKTQEMTGDAEGKKPDSLAGQKTALQDWYQMRDYLRIEDRKYGFCVLDLQWRGRTE